MISTILHIGAGKCGSSALQTIFSQHPELASSDGKKTHYLALRHDGSPLHGKKLSLRAASAPWGYISSVNANLLIELPESKIQSMSRELRLLTDSNDRVLLSNEGWINEYKTFEKSDLLTKLGLTCTVIVYVRPPVEWLNSAWWQWGAWSGTPLDKWLNANLEKVQWHDLIAPWKNLQGVEKVSVRLLPLDVVTDFYNAIEVPPIPSKRSNSGLPGTILRLYQRHPGLRKSPHDSAGDFVFSKYFGHIADDPTPWVLGPYMIKKILESTRESNTKLMGLLDEESRALMENDSRWWDAAAFSDKKKSPPTVENLSPPRLEEILVTAMKSIRKLEDENRELKNNLHKLSEKFQQSRADSDSRTSNEIK